MPPETLAWLPRPPLWQLDWQAVLAACPWLAPLAAVPQDPIFHAEGDVLTHTHMVAEALVALPAWRAFPAHEQALLLLAALLHDVGKATCTQLEADGRISSRGHARAGAASARRLLWSREGLGQALAFAPREAVVNLVRFHGLPLQFLDQPDLDRVVLTASYRTRLDMLALLAEADVRGRVCADHAELLMRVELFRELCQERDCLVQPYPFVNDQSRVRYFRQGQRDPSYCAYDDSWGEVTLLAGLPGAGKDTWLQQQGLGLPIISLDGLRLEMDVDMTDDQGAVVAAAKDQARALLRRHQPFVWNATNLNRPRRDPLVELMLAYGARVRLVYVDAPLETVLQRNRQRATAVPEAVVRRMAGRTEPPDLTEAHAVQVVGEGDDEVCGT